MFGLKSFWPLSYLGGRKAVSFNLRSDTYKAEVLEPDDATASFTIDGSAVSGGPDSDSGILNYDWLTGALGSDYEVFASPTSGVLSSGTTSSWLALTSARTWTVEKTTPGLREASIRIEIRKIGTTAIVAAAADINLRAYVEF